LAASLCRGARAAFQFYPESDDQVTFIMSFAVKAGFTGGLVVDYPNSTKKKKYYLVLISGQADSTAPSKAELPAALGVDEGDEAVPYEQKRQRTKKTRDGKRTSVKNRDWILHKKQLNKARGKEVPMDSKCAIVFLFPTRTESADRYTRKDIRVGGGSRFFEACSRCCDLDSQHWPCFIFFRVMAARWISRHALCKAVTPIHLMNIVSGGYCRFCIEAGAQDATTIKSTHAHSHRTSS
jgi:Methyltransferase involved in Williams-Beuren syndrome